MNRWRKSPANVWVIQGPAEGLHTAYITGEAVEVMTKSGRITRVTVEHVGPPFMSPTVSPVPLAVAHPTGTKAGGVDITALPTIEPKRAPHPIGARYAKNSRRRRTRQ